MALLYAVLSVVAFSALGAAYKLSDKLKCDKRQVNFVFLASAAVMCLVWAAVSHQLVWVPGAVGLGVCLGILVFANVVIFRKAVAAGRISTSWTVMNLALVVPVVVSVLLWHEHPKPAHCFGAALTLLAILMIGVDIGRSAE